LTSTEAPRKKRLLVVDDDRDLAEAMTAVLSDRYQVDVAGDGQEALERVDQGSYDLILLDLVMPRLDGGGVVRALRTRSAAPPVLLLSGSEDLVERARELGVESHLAKPVETEVLQERIAALLARRAA